MDDREASLWTSVFALRYSALLSAEWSRSDAAEAAADEADYALESVRERSETTYTALDT